MTELKLSTATEATKPVEKIVEEVKVPAEVPTTDANNTAKPIEVVEKVVTAG